MSVLFTPIKLNRLEIKNRFVHSATCESMAELDGSVTPLLLKRYQKLARGEVGLIIPGFMYVHPYGKTLHNEMGIYDDRMIPGLTELVNAVHENGSKIVFSQKKLPRNNRNTYWAGRKFSLNSVSMRAMVMMNPMGSLGW